MRFRELLIHLEEFPWRRGGGFWSETIFAQALEILAWIDV